MQRPSLSAVLAALSLTLACGDSEPEADIAHYTDQLGRMCTVDRNDISLTADCDVDPPVSCAAGTEAAFTISADLNGIVRNCGACVDVAKHQTSIDSPSCSPLTCSADADCVTSRNTCQMGNCMQ